mgnify:FL=1
MPNQTTRQQARRVALDAQTRMRQARAEKERRRSALAVSVVTALAERDALVQACEARAGAALRALTGAEGLTLREAVEWCGGEEQLSVREATRLRRVEPSDPTSGDGSWADTEEDGEGVEPAASVDVSESGASGARDGSGRGAAG